MVQFFCPNYRKHFLGLFDCMILRTPRLKQAEEPLFDGSNRFIKPTWKLGVVRFEECTDVVNLLRVHGLDNTTLE